MRRLVLAALGYLLAFGVVVAVVAIAPLSSTSAQTPVTANQGQGAPNAQEWFTMIGARRGGATSKVCVTNAAGGSFIPGNLTHTPLANRKAIAIQNLGPNPIQCTIDGQAPVANPGLANLGWQIPALGGANVWMIDAGPSIVVRCIAATAAQDAATGCTNVAEVR